MQLLSLFTLPQAQNVVVLFKRFNFIYSSPSNINAFNIHVYKAIYQSIFLGPLFLLWLTDSSVFEKVLHDVPNIT